MGKELQLNDINVSELSNDELIKLYNDLETFIKLVSEEIKKTDVGDQDE